ESRRCSQPGPASRRSASCLGATESRRSSSPGLREPPLHPSRCHEPPLHPSRCHEPPLHPSRCHEPPLHPSRCHEPPLHPSRCHEPPLHPSRCHEQPLHPSRCHEQPLHPSRCHEQPLHPSRLGGGLPSPRAPFWRGGVFMPVSTGGSISPHAGQPRQAWLCALAWGGPTTPPPPHATVPPPKLPATRVEGEA
uniref:Uncharacterized protein n=1 Tax=Astyanax mexicanus TaxID=7994 RepID=A0A3B1K3R9_ASTMX